MKKFSNLTGAWIGTFGYPNNVAEPNAFHAEITNRHDGTLSGTAKETSIHGQPIRTHLDDACNGYSVLFNKTYLLESGTALTATYIGSADRERQKISGSWYLLEGHEVLWSGPFQMERATQRAESRGVRSRM